MKNWLVNKKYYLLAISLVIILVLSVLITQKFYYTGETIKSIEFPIVPLSSPDKEKIKNLVESDSRIKEIPSDYPVSLRFFSFKNGERIWHDEFLISEGKLIASGEPEVYLSLHSKYLSQLREDNLCEIIQEANRNRDLGFYSETNKVSLFWKYKSLMKYRNCIDP